MPVIPDKKLEQIQFSEQHLPIWQPIATSLGLSTTALAALTAATEDARKSYEEALAARQASKAATLIADNDISTMNVLLSDAIKRIRLTAESTNNPNIYGDAQIPAPAAPTDALPPTQPTALRITIESMGQLMLQWKVSPSTTGFDSSTSSVMFTIFRKVNSETNFSIVGTARPARSGSRGYTSFTDESLPANPSNLQYVVQGRRTTSTGDLIGQASDVFSVTIGTGGDAMIFVKNVTNESSANVKLAA